MPYVLSTAWIEPGKTEKLREWGAEIVQREDEVLQTLRNEGVRQEIAFVLPTEHGDLLCVFLEIDDPEEANKAFFSSSYKIDQEHAAVMDEISGGRGRTPAEFLYAFFNPKESS